MGVCSVRPGAYMPSDGPVGTWWKTNQKPVSCRETHYEHTSTCTLIHMQALIGTHTHTLSCRYTHTCTHTVCTSTHTYTQTQALQHAFTHEHTHKQRPTHTYTQLTHTQRIIRKHNCSKGSWPWECNGNVSACSVWSPGLINQTLRCSTMRFSGSALCYHQRGEG